MELKIQFISFFFAACILFVSALPVMDLQKDIIPKEMNFSPEKEFQEKGAETFENKHQILENHEENEQKNSDFNLLGVPVKIVPVDKEHVNGKPDEYVKLIQVEGYRFGQPYHGAGVQATKVLSNNILVNGTLIVEKSGDDKPSYFEILQVQVPI